MRDANTRPITTCCFQNLHGKKYLNRPAWQKWWCMFALVALRGQRVKASCVRGGFPRVLTWYSRMLLTPCSSDCSEKLLPPRSAHTAPHWYRPHNDTTEPEHLASAVTNSSPRPLHLYVADVTRFQSSSFQSETVLSLVSMEAWWWNILLFPVLYGMFA